ncbi:MAG: hypothetical protein KI790_14745 [Cyclobacteriaceae bacterium]|nr:hypothetical protein [Cyclobacteriaceae bacterium HetDA_MAG_MS6]
MKKLFFVSSTIVSVFLLSCESSEDIAGEEISQTDLTISFAEDLFLTLEGFIIVHDDELNPISFYSAENGSSVRIQEEIKNPSITFMSKSPSSNIFFPSTYIGLPQKGNVLIATAITKLEFATINISVVQPQEQYASNYIFSTPGNRIGSSGFLNYTSSISTHDPTVPYLILTYKNHLDNSWNYNIEEIPNSKNVIFDLSNSSKLEKMIEIPIASEFISGEFAFSISTNGYMNNKETTLPFSFFSIPAINPTPNNTFLIPDLSNDFTEVTTQLIAQRDNLVYVENATDESLSFEMINADFLVKDKVFETFEVSIVGNPQIQISHWHYPVSSSSSASWRIYSPDNQINLSNLLKIKELDHPSFEAWTIDELTLRNFIVADINTMDSENIMAYMLSNTIDGFSVRKSKSESFY